MNGVLTIIAGTGARVEDDDIASACAALAEGASVGAARWLTPGRACEIAFAGDAAVRRMVAARLADRPLDLAVVPAAGRQKRVLVADMESTVIENEMIDEIATLAGLDHARIAAITARTMAGEIDFAAALRERVALFAGLSATVLDAAAARIRPMPGAEALVRTMNAAGALTVLVSGGFTCFARPVAARLGFARVHANRLGIADGRLTGTVHAPLIDRAAKRRILEETAAERGLDAAETLAVGDGANDLDMLAAAGLGVGFRPKPVVAEAAGAVIRHAGLEAVLYLQGMAPAA